MFKHLLISLAALALLTNVSWAADTYNIDPAHSEVGFKVTHMVISKVNGKFDDYSVSFTFDPDNLSASKIDATIKIASVDTDNEKRDNHLTSSDFFDAKEFPDMTFKSTKIEKINDGYIAHGKLTIRGVSKEIDLPFTVTVPVKDPWGNERLGIAAKTTINRQDYNVSWSNTLDGGGLVVSDNVDIIITAEFVKSK